MIEYVYHIVLVKGFRALLGVVGFLASLLGSGGNRVILKEGVYSIYIYMYIFGWLN